MISKLCNWIAKIPHDKLLHFIIVYLMTDLILSLVGNITYIPIIVTIIIISFILLKEHIDEYNYNGFCWFDILAGFLGYITKMILFVTSVI